MTDVHSRVTLDASIDKFGRRRRNGSVDASSTFLRGFGIASTRRDVRIGPVHVLILFKLLTSEMMLTSAFRAAQFTYSNVGMIRPFFFRTDKSRTTPSDVEATLTLISTALNQWGADDPVRELVEEAHKQCVFLWETIILKKKKHHKKWFSDWRSLSLEDEYDALIHALQVLEHRYTMAVLSKMSINTSHGTTHASPAPSTAAASHRSCGPDPCDSKTT